MVIFISIIILWRVIIALRYRIVVCQLNALNQLALDDRVGRSYGSGRDPMMSGGKINGNSPCTRGT